MKYNFDAAIKDLKSIENQNTIIYLASSVFSAFAGFVMLRYFTKYLGPEDIGIFGYVTAFNAFVLPFVTLNLQTFYIRQVYSVTGEEIKKQILGSILVFTLFWSILITAIFILLGSVLFHALDIKVPFFPYMFYTFLSNIGITIATYLLLQYRILLKAGSYFYITTLQTILLIGVSYSFVGLIQWGIYGRIFGIFLGSITLGIICFLLLQKHINYNLNKAILLAGLKFSLPLVPYSVATLLYDMLDRFFLERYSASMSSTGIYNIGAQYAIIMSTISLAFYRAYEPAIYKLAAEKNDQAIIKNITFLNNIMLLFAIPLILMSNSLINYLTNGKFSGSAYVACLLIVAFYFQSAYIMLNTVLTSLNRTKAIMWVSLLGVVLVSLCSVLLVPIFNNTGTAVIKIILYISLFLSSFLIIRKSGAYSRYIFHTICTGFILITLIFLLRSFNYF